VNALEGGGALAKSDYTSRHDTTNNSSVRITITEASSWVGSYTVTAWHEGAKSQSTPVTVSGSRKVDFTLTK
jgi:hypothetical protein